MTGRPSFRVWRGDMNIPPWSKHLQFWQWECTLCDPPVAGGRYGVNAWTAILRTSLPHHMSRRKNHHRWVATRRGTIPKG